MAKNPKSKKSILPRIGFVMVALYTVFMLLDMQVTLADRSDELTVLEEQYELQRIENKDLQRQATDVANGLDNEEIERIAREQLNFVAPNEKVFIDVSGS